MSWFSKLYEMYGVIERFESSRDTEPKLLLAHHISQTAHLEITIDCNGNFIKAEPIEKSDESKRTVVPVTLDSNGRTSGVAPHALFDWMQYIAFDLSDYVEEKIAKKARECNEKYLSQLREWAENTDHPMPIAIFAYLKKGTTTKDLIDNKIVSLDPKGKFYLKKSDFSKDAWTTIDISKVFVRFIVRDAGLADDRAYREKTLRQDWIRFYTGKLEREKPYYREMCAVTGIETECTRKHSKNIRRDGDSAKLISANDTGLATFRGRFQNPEEVVNVGAKVSEKAHAALKWLIENQGISKGGLTVVAFSAGSDPKIPGPYDDEFGEGDSLPDTGQVYADELKKIYDGYARQVGAKEVCVLALASATPGRMSVNFYREFAEAQEYFDSLAYWHKTTAWDGNYREKKKRHGFVSPTLRIALRACYGENPDEKLEQAFYERMLPCVIDRAKLPEDIMKNAFQRTLNRKSFQEGKWRNALSATCSLIRKFYRDCQKEEFTMALDTSRKTRDYLFGRLLAVAEAMESRVLFERNEKRETAAERYFRQYFTRPVETWRTIQLTLSAYERKYKDILGFYQRELYEITDEIAPEFFTAKWNKPLKPEALIGYYHQRAKDFQPRKKTENENENIFTEEQK